MAAPSYGAKAVADSQAQSTLAEAEVTGERMTAELKLVGTKTFVLRNGVWTDTVYDPQKMHVTHLQFDSVQYFDLLAERPEWGKYLAVGDRVVVVLEGKAYQIEPGDTEQSRVTEPSVATPGVWKWFWDQLDRLIP
jgi:Ca-activated chloride channel family protein